MDLELLQGAWRAVRIENEGSPVPDDLAATIRYIFDDDRVILMEGDQKAGEGVIRLAPASDPKAFDFTATEGTQKGMTVLGIYRVAGDALTMCLGNERPSLFTSTGKSVLVELTRIG